MRSLNEKKQFGKGNQNLKAKLVYTIKQLFRMNKQNGIIFKYLQCDPNRARRTTASMENTQDLLIAPTGTTLNLETKQLGT